MRLSISPTRRALLAFAVAYTVQRTHSPLRRPLVAPPPLRIDCRCVGPERLIELSSEVQWCADIGPRNKRSLRRVGPVVAERNRQPRSEDSQPSIDSRVRPNRARTDQAGNW